MNTENLQAILQPVGVSAVRYFESIGSTNDEALQWAGQGAPDFALVTADTQSSGRGRMGRKWVSTAGACLAFSLVLRPTPPETNCITLFSPLGSLAIQRVLQNNYRLPCEVKWPNDVLIYRKKVAGILVEIDWNGASPEGIIQGIGVNISQAAVPPASDLLFPATSLEDELGYRPDRWEFLRQVLAQIKALRPLLPTGALIKEWEKHLAFAGERVRVESTVQPPQIGRLIGLGQDGSLLLQSDQEEIISIAAGDVHAHHLRPLGEE